MNEGPVRLRLLKRVTLRKLSIGAAALVVVVVLAGVGVWLVKHQVTEADKAAQTTAGKDAKALAQEAMKTAMDCCDRADAAVKRAEDAADRAEQAAMKAGKAFELQQRK